VRRGEHAAIDHGVRENLRVEHVDQRDRVAARTLLHDEALEDLDLAAQETELARDGEAECVDRTAGLEETPERIRNAEVGLGVVLATPYLGWRWLGPGIRRRLRRRRRPCPAVVLRHRAAKRHRVL